MAILWSVVVTPDLVEAIERLRGKETRSGFIRRILKAKLGLEPERGPGLRRDQKGNVAAIAVVVVLVVVAAAIAVFASGLLSPFLRPGCTVQGAVVTLEGGDPIGGARVELGSGGSDLGVTFTGADGRYRFAIARDHCNGAVAQLLVSSGVDFKLVSLNLPAAPGETLTAPTVGL